MTDELEKLVVRKKECEEQIMQLEEMQTTLGYKLLHQTLEAQLRAQRLVDFENSLESLDSAFKASRQRGVLAGLQMAVNAPNFLIADLTEGIKVLSDEIAELEEDDNTIPEEQAP